MLQPDHGSGVDPWEVDQLHEQRRSAAAVLDCSVQQTIFMDRCLKARDTNKVEDAILLLDTASKATAEP